MEARAAPGADPEPAAGAEPVLCAVPEPSVESMAELKGKAKANVESAVEAAVMERLERELMLLARHQVLVHADRHSERLNRSAYVLLSCLESQGPMTIGELAEGQRLRIETPGGGGFGRAA